MTAGDNPYASSTAAEIDLLLLCARRCFTPVQTALLKRILEEEELDWRFILAAASRHGLLALLWASLKSQNCIDLVPAHITEKLQAAVREATARTLALTGELTRILGAFSLAGIRAMPCKGPVAAMAAYGDLSFRSFCDLDVLVTRRDLDQARHRLTLLGYRHHLPFSAQQERDYLNNECALALRHEQHGHIVEIHWRFTERNASVELPVEAFWKRARPIPVAGMPVLALCPEDLVLYLCVHGAKHRWERLEWIACLAETIRANPALDWNSVFKTSRSYRIARLLNLGLRLTQTLLGAELPPVAIQRLQEDPGVDALSQWVKARLFSAAPDETHYQQRAARYWFMLRSREHWADRLRIVLYSAIRPPHPSAPEWLDLPPRLAFLHHIFRPVRLLGEYGAVAWNRYLRVR